MEVMIDKVEDAADEMLECDVAVLGAFALSLVGGGSGDVILG